MNITVLAKCTVITYNLVFFLSNPVSGGGSGFIGTALANSLKRKGYDVRIISRKPGPWRTTWVGDARVITFVHQSSIHYLL